MSCDDRQAGAEPQRRAAYVVGVALCLALCGTACRPVDVASLHSGAIQAAAAGHWRSAVELTEQCRTADPGNVDIMVLHGFCLFEMRRVEEALEHLAAAAAAAPDKFIPQFFYGWILSETGRHGDAIGPLRSAYELRAQYPKHVGDVLVLLSRCCLEQKLPEGKSYLQGLRRYRTPASSAEVYNGLGMLYFYEAQYENARESFLTALDSDPENAVVLQNLAVLHDQYLLQPKPAQRYYIHCLKASQLAGDNVREVRIRERLRHLIDQRRKAVE